MPLSLLCAIALASDSWSLKAPLTVGTKLTWALSGHVTFNGGDHDVSCKLIEEIKSGDKAKGQPIVGSMADIAMDGSEQPNMEVSGWVSDQNLFSKSDDEPHRRMIAPMFFVYPTSDVKVGDSWKAEIPAPDKDTPKLSFEFTAKKTETVDGADLLVVESKGKEDGTDSPLTADGTWWLDKTGKAVKFKLKFVNWRVPEAGGAPMDITFDGKLSS